MGTLGLVTSIVMVSSSSVLSVAYSVILVHILRGSKNKWLIKVVICLLLAELFNVLWGVYAGKLFSYYPTDETQTNPPLSVSWVYSFAMAAYNIFFNVGHYLISEKYAKIAEEVPAHLEGKDIKPESKSDKLKRRLMLAFICVSGVLQAVSSGYFFSI